MASIFALVDCNSFYCSCERLFRPDLWHRPVGVLSNNDGCFVSRTKELKALGVPMGAPYFKYKDICHKNNVAVFSSNFSLYTNISDRIMKNLARFTSELEVYSVDEAFLNLEGINFDLRKYCLEIKRVIERNTGIPVSIGIGQTKTLAKVANHIAKNDMSTEGVFCVLKESSRNKALEKVKVQSIWGIGKQSAMKLNALNIKNAKDFRDFNNDYLIQKNLTKVGRMTQDELRGISCYELNMKVEKKKEILSSRTFGQPVFDLLSLRESVASYASLACEKLRKQESVCSSVEVWIRTNPHKNVKQYYAVDSYLFGSQTSDTRKIIKYAWKILDKIYKEGYEYKKALVKLSGIRDRDSTQLSFFEARTTLEDDNLMKIMDIVNDKEGPHTIRCAACGVDNKAWKMKQTMKSQRYVTGWSELPKVLL